MLFRRLHKILLILICVSSTFFVACSNQKGPLFKSQSKRAVTHGEYVVEKGDSLYSIAWRYKRDYKELASINGIGAPYTIYVGQKLKLSKYQDEIPSKYGYTGQSVVKQPARPKAYSKSRTRTPNRYSSKRRRQQAPTKTYSSKKLNWAWPAQGKVIQSFSTSSVGKKGIQIAGNAGDTIKASANGKVVYSGDSLVGYGNLVIVKHNKQFLTAYAHNRRVVVKEGDSVTQGQKIAEMGSSGTDRNKLHFEIRSNGKPVNPKQYLPAR